MSTSTSTTPQPLGVTLLLVPSVLAAQEYEGQTVPLAVGTCSLDLVSLSSTVDDAYLVIKIEAEALTSSAAREKEKPRTDEAFQMVISTEQMVEVQPTTSAGTKYLIQSTEVQGANISLTLPAGTRDLDAFQDILQQYCGLIKAGSQEGRVELVDESGNLIGALDPSIQPGRVSDRGNSGGSDNALLIHDDDDDAASFYSSIDTPITTTGMGGSTATTTTTTTRSAGNAPPVTGASAQETDWLINGAHYVSKGILGVSGWLGGAVEKGANRHTSAKGTSAPNSGTATPTGTSTNTSAKYLDDKSGTGLTSPAYATDYGSTAGGSGVFPTTTGDVKGKTNVPIHPSISKGLAALASGSGHVVNLSGTARTMILNTSDQAGRRIGGIRGSKNKDGTPRQPGAVRTQLQRGATAANIVLDGFDTAVGGLLDSVGTSSGKLVGHTFGAQAQSASGQLGQMGRNCFLVYKDVSGVRRKCLLKLAGGTLKGRTVDGQEIEITASSEQALMTGNGGSGGTRPSTIGFDGHGSGGALGSGYGAPGADQAAVSGKVPAPRLASSSTTTGVNGDGGIAPPRYSSEKSGSGYPVEKR